MLESFQATDFAEPISFLRLTTIFFVIVWLRYLLVSSAFHLSIHRLFKTKMQQRILHQSGYSKGQMQKEIIWSTITSIIFGLAATLMVIVWQYGWTRLYFDWRAYPLWYLPISLLAALFIHDTYYYWLHRWMHRSRSVYLTVHKVHHDSVITNAMTSFSFHPIESLFQAAIVPLIILILPMHISILLVMLVLMTVSGTINHVGAELYHSRPNTHWLWKWIIGATHHDLHHTKFNHNFGLYFTFWDRMMGTEWEQK